MSDVENTVSDGQFFANTFDTPKESAEQHIKGECLKGAVSKGKPLSRNKQWTFERVDKTSNNTINKTHAEYKQVN